MKRTDEGDGDPRPISIVTGGAGSIGREIGHQLAGQGFRVCAVDLDIDRLDQESWFPGHLAYAGDVSDEATVVAFYEWLSGQGTITVVVNAAGISPKAPTGKISNQEVTLEQWHRVFDVNTLAPFLMMRHALPHLPDDGSASIVNIISIASRMAAGGLKEDVFPPIISSALHYSASKAALRNLTISFSREFASRHVRVNDVAPGFIATEMTHRIPLSEQETVIRQIPLARPGVPEDIANAVSFLVSDRAAYITGATIDVNGGWMPT